MNYILNQPVQAQALPTNYQCQVQWRAGSFIADEPTNVGGTDTGPDPFSLLAASLATCTVSTLRMYCVRKNWPLTELHVGVNFHKTEDSAATTVFVRSISIAGNITDEQRLRLMQIARACPVSKILSGSASIETELKQNT